MLSGPWEEDADVAEGAQFQSIGELFYRTRVLRGREWTLRRFATELGVDHVLLSYIEKGQRFPSEELVRKLAAIRREDARELLAVLYRDRMVRAFAREIRRALTGEADDDPSATKARRASTSAVLSRAVAALPD